MKCPKCGYLGFETSERCRNCGYDFSLAIDVGSPADELVLRSAAGAGEPLADFDLNERDSDRIRGDVGRFDLDRVIGDDQPGALSAHAAAGAPGAAGAAGAPSAANASEVDEPVAGVGARLRPSATSRGLGATRSASATTPGAPSAHGPPEGPSAHRPPAAPSAPGAKNAPVAPSAPVVPSAPGTLPLFGGDDDTPLLTVPRPVLPPLSVRRTTPEIPRARQRPNRPSVQPTDDGLAFHLDGEPAAHVPPAAGAGMRDHTLTPASVFARLGAAVVDLVLLGLINAVVVYLTLALAGLSWQRYAALPLAPLVGFLALLNGGYLIVFVAAGGQTIGKMMTGLRVVQDDGQRVDITGAVLRASGCAASLLTLGAGYLPAFFGADRRALHDRISGTRVVRAR